MFQRGASELRMMLLACLPSLHCGHSIIPILFYRHVYVFVNYNQKNKTKTQQSQKRRRNVTICRVAELPLSDTFIQGPQVLINVGMSSQFPGAVADV